MGGRDSTWDKFTGGVGRFLMMVTGVVATTRATGSDTVDGVAWDYPQSSKRTSSKEPRPLPSWEKGDKESVATSTSEDPSQKQSK